MPNISAQNSKCQCTQVSSKIGNEPVKQTWTKQTHRSEPLGEGDPELRLSGLPTGDTLLEGLWPAMTPQKIFTKQSADFIYPYNDVKPHASHLLEVNDFADVLAIDPCRDMCLVITSYSLVVRIAENFCYNQNVLKCYLLSTTILHLHWLKTNFWKFNAIVFFCYFL